MHLDQPHEVEGLLTRSLHILQTASGEDHPHAAWAMHRLADFYRSPATSCAGREPVSAGDRHMEDRLRGSAPEPCSQSEGASVNST